MKKRIIYGCVAVVIIVAIVILVKTVSSPDDSHAINMPSPAVDSGGSAGDDGINRVEVTPETVKAVLGTLSRAESFSRRFSSPPRTSIEMSARKAKAEEKRVSCW